MSTTFRLIVPLAFLLANSPLTRTHTGAPIAPIPLIANSVPQPKAHADADTSANQRLRLAATALLFPANLATFVASSKPFDPDGPELATVNLQQLWDTAIEKATARMASVDGMAHPEVLLTGSWCLVFGSILSFLLRRVHVVQLFGLAMLGAYMFQNGLKPTLQFGSIVAAVLGQISLAKQEARVDEPATVAKAETSEAEAGKGGGKEKKKTK